MRTPREVFDDFASRRRAILRALTSESEKFYLACDPNKDNLCLYGYPDGSWAVDLPAEEVPPEAPEPALGINFARDGMERKDWLGLVAVHSDAWLLGLAFYKGARLNREQREELFFLINKVPTCYEVVTGRGEPSQKRALPQQQGGRGGSSGSVKREKREQAGSRAHDGDADYEEAGDGHANGAWEDGEGDPCPSCARSYRQDEFWIACDNCDQWYCGKCARMTQAKAERTQNWNCSKCAEQRDAGR